MVVSRDGTIDEFRGDEHPYYNTAQKAMEKARSKQVRDLFGFGFSVHHAGEQEQSMKM